MEFKLVLGIDESKDDFNYSLMNAEFDYLQEGKVINHPVEITKFIDKLLSNSCIQSIDELLLIVEHTGIYTQHLLSCWLSKGGKATVVHAPKVSQGLTGLVGWDEKTDQADARRLGEYALRFRDKLELWELKADNLMLLQRLHRQRQRLINALNMLQVPVSECNQFDPEDIAKKLVFHQASTIEAIKQDLKKVEKSLNEIIQQDENLKQLFQLITSVEGVGAVTAREIIIVTGAFKDFSTNQAKTFARFVGVIPRKKESGKSVRRKNKISNRPHKKLKSLLTMGALSLVATKGELGIYYRRKRAEGKHHLSVINAMRNKLILRIFAVVRNQVMYQKNLNISLV